MAETTLSTHLKDCPDVRSFSKRGAHKVLELSGKAAGDTDWCSFISATFTETGDILLADQGNNKLKLFTEAGQHIHQLKLSSRPYDVTVIDRTTAAVTLDAEMRIQMITMLNGKLIISRSIDVGDQCYGITYVDGKLAVACRDAGCRVYCVKVMSIGGHVLHSITKDHEGKFLKGADYIASKPGQACDPAKLYVSAFHGDSVLCYTIDGQCLFQYRSSDLRLIRGITVDEEGHIYVGSWNNIHLVSADGMKGRVLLVSNAFTTALCLLCYDQRQDRLVVTHTRPSIVMVYQLE
jgi:hypothetical protein